MLDRRRFLATFSGLGTSSALFPGVLWALADGKSALTPEMIDQAAAIAGVPVSAADRKMMLEALNDRVKGFEEISKLRIANATPPAIVFDPVLSSTKFETEKRPLALSAVSATARAPKNLEELAFASARELGELVRSKRISSLALTEMYLERLKRYDPQLHFAITLTEDRAQAQAREADRELASGRHRGPLHGLPWGAKDLLAVKGYRTTWGAGGFEEQAFAEDATVVKRLDEAGAVLVAKLSLGALAMGDRWFRGKTRNPWNPAQGSSGSSAGSASATAAGCVAFSIGSETLGSISSPSTRCGSTGLRPTFGLVPRTGAMALSWSMDKLGPICRAVEDTAIVLHAIYGPDGRDRSVKTAAFNWNAGLDWKQLRVGYLKAEFERSLDAPEEAGKPEAELSEEDKKKREEERQRRAELRKHAEYDRRFDVAALEKLKAMGVQLIPLELPKFPYDAMVPLLDAEAAAAFDELTRSGRDKLLTEQGPDDWPNAFRTARFLPAVEYIQANRARMMAMEAVSEALEGFDVVVAPTAGQQLVVTNLTGHPALILPNGFRGEDAPAARKDEKGEIAGGYGGPGTPVSLTFVGQLYGESRLLALARAYQEATGFHLRHPNLAPFGPPR
jgi:Asp-tRNA(Asn)/Glu-tRNA(Gln) amidotransferase A subunit family amidase